jgi:hypothetical protein
MMFVKYNNSIGFVKLSNGQSMNLSERQLQIFEKLINDAEEGRVYVYISDLIGVHLYRSQRMDSTA